MNTVGVNSPKTAVTKGSTGIAAATLPNVCKMPGPPAPFLPVPLPNIGMSGTSPQGYSKTVMIGGEAVAIQGASFGSQGDIASKPTGGGMVSANTHGPTKFLGPGAMNVKIEGKNVQLLGDPMLNNCGPNGAPANSATMMGVTQVPQEVLFPELPDGEDPTLCVDGGAHRWEVSEAKGKKSLEAKIDTLKKNRSPGTKFEGRAAEHNKRSGELQRSSQLSAGENKKRKKNRGKGNVEKIMWNCAVCHKYSREGDQLHDGPNPGDPPIAVEVKSKSSLGPEDYRQLGRNIQALKQGGASGLIYKLKAGPAGNGISADIDGIAKKMSCTIRIVRV